MKLILTFAILFWAAGFLYAQSIDREALVKRHTIKIDEIDSLSTLSLGNGEFIFSTDFTGLQTFPQLYKNGLPLGSWSQWGWYSQPNTEGFTTNELVKEYTFNDKKLPYLVPAQDTERKKYSTLYFQQNPRRLQLGFIGLELLKPDGSRISKNDITNIHQELQLWEGRLHSMFEVNGVPVEVVTYCHGEKDLIAAEVRSPLIRQGLLKIKLSFPSPIAETNDSSVFKHVSLLSGLGSNAAYIMRKKGNTSYSVKIDWSSKGAVSETNFHEFVLSPDVNQDKFSFSFLFSPEVSLQALPDFIETQINSSTLWKKYWQQGGVVDFSNCQATKAQEIERRVVLSQYLAKIHCTSSTPPQTSGIASYNGQIEIDQHFWLSAHFALWGRANLIEKSLNWHKNILPIAEESAKQQGFAGARWPASTNIYGQETPSNNSFIIWQQPNIIYLAELIYRQYPNRNTMARYYNMVLQSADYMAAYAWFEKNKNRYILGPAQAATQENTSNPTAINPTFELAYWYWGLSTAQLWLERLQRPRNEKWDDVLTKLSTPASEKGMYLASENSKGVASFTTKSTPIALSAFGLLPKNRLTDSTIAQNTFNHIAKTEQWRQKAPWGSSLMAMTATRLGHPNKAIEALLLEKGTFLKNGLYMSDRINLSGNSSLLAAIAMMCAGFDNNNTVNPGFPEKDWNIKWEGLSKMP